jgi:hypothetical protein
MIRQSVENEFKLIAAIITDEDAEPVEHLKRFFNPSAVPPEHYKIEVHPTLASIAPEFKNGLIIDRKTLDSLEDIVRANLEGRNCSALKSLE